MTKLRFEYTGREAQQMLKEVYPNNWEVKMKDGASLLLRLKKTWNKETLELTYEKYMSYSGSSASSIEMLSSLQYLKDLENQNTKTLRSQIEDLLHKQDQVVVQQEALEKSSMTSENDKRQLRMHYRELQSKYALELLELTNSIEVIDPFILVIQGNLFNQST